MEFQVYENTYAACPTSRAGNSTTVDLDERRSAFKDS